VVYVNSVGGQDELVFDGGSLIVGADGELLYRAAQFRPERFWVDVPLGGSRGNGSVRPVTVHTRPSMAREVVPSRPPAPEARDDEQVWQALVLGTRDFAHRNGVRTAVMGLSGGIDAAVTAAVCADALGPSNLLALAMPGAQSPAEELEDARSLASALGIAFRSIPIGPAAAALSDALPAQLEEGQDEQTTAALEARARAAILWAVADQHGHLALATGNKSELSIGTGSLHGDMAGAFAPLKDCPKTMLYRLARWRNARESAIPKRVLDRPPTVHMITDDVLPSFEEIDPIVERYIERGEGPEELIAAGFDAAAVRSVLQLVDDSELKRRQTPPGVKITARAFGHDRHMPITNAWRPFGAEEARLFEDPRATVEAAGEVVG
jgi:NAD+ synthase (glutamine-hydrolysing)